jgi:hypothetical protein
MPVALLLEQFSMSLATRKTDRAVRLFFLSVLAMGLFDFKRAILFVW